MKCCSKLNTRPIEQVPAGDDTEKVAIVFGDEYPTQIWLLGETADDIRKFILRISNQ